MHTDDRSRCVLVTGGAGYIGSHTAHALRDNGYTPILYDNLCTGFRRLASGFELVEGGISDTAKLAPLLARVDAVIHFAAHAYVGESVLVPQKYFKNNLQDGLIFLDAVIRSQVRKFVFSSSCAVYGIPKTIPITESSPLLPINPYGETKLGLESALASHDIQHGLRFVSLRYFNAAGADEKGRVGEMHSPETHLIPSAFAALRGTRGPLEIMGDDYSTPDGTCIRDYVHVSDLADAHVQALKYLGNGESVALNLGSGHGRSVREIIETIESVTGRAVPSIITDRRQGDPAELVADPEKARQLLSWNAKRSIENIVSTAWAWEQHRPTG